MLLNYVGNAAPSLDREAYELAFSASNALSGVSGTVPDETAAYNEICSNLLVPLEKAFIEKYDPARKKADVTRLCEMIIECYRSMLEGEAWLSEETRAEAIHKLECLRIKAVCPDSWEDTSVLNLEGCGYAECVRRVSEYMQEKDLSRTNGTVDRSLWDAVNILDANAYYQASENTVYILAGLLDGLFYREDMTTEELYAGLGFIIGHELSHAFDTLGAQFDENGNMNTWWSEEDYTAFTEDGIGPAFFY